MRQIATSPVKGPLWDEQAAFMSSLKARISGSVAIRLPASRAKSTCDPVRTSAHTYITPHVCSPTALHCDACSWSSSALSQGPPLRLRRHHGRCTPVSRRLPASPKSAAAGQKRSFMPRISATPERFSATVIFRPPWRPERRCCVFAVPPIDADRYRPIAHVIRSAQKRGWQPTHCLGSRCWYRHLLRLTAEA